MTTHYDVVILGSGPGGEGAAMKATKEGRRVAVVERYEKIGGGCTHWGTIPSKALRHTISRMAEYKANPLFASSFEAYAVSFPRLLRSAEGVIRRQVELRHGFYERNRTRVIHGHGRFVDPHTLEVEGAHNARERLTADHFVIATGAKPYRPPGVDFTHPRVRDSDTILAMEDTPQSMVIFGAGVIGCEYASMFRTLGIKVTLVNTRDKLLSYLDDEIVDALAYHLRDQGCLLRHNEDCARIEADAEGVTLHLRSGKLCHADVLLWANGRSGNTADLGLEALGITPDPRGLLQVDGCYRTSHPHIYAVGDVIGPPSLASAAYDQGRFAATHLVHGECDEHLARDIPTGIYTTPEISSLGRTERELTEAKVPYEVGHALFRSLARAQITGQTVGMLKLLFHRETLELLGIHCFGHQASEIIHIGQAVMTQAAPANTLKYFVYTTFNYPTMAEAYRVAALNGLNRLR
ncbi:MAG: Si-specific NAD(P)(+) transhydrogenase [Deltaproteobacteria bacterium]|nr:Si-specific NAD(P)(+) transhydrogenase [Deltaproteobacteria bacterium]